MNKSNLTLGNFDIQDADDNCCEIGAWATDGISEKYFGVVVKREDAFIIGQKYVTAMFEEFRDHNTMLERCQCGMTRERKFGDDETWDQTPCIICGARAHSFEPRPKPVNGREIDWQEPVKEQR